MLRTGHDTHVRADAKIRHPADPKSSNYACLASLGRSFTAMADRPVVQFKVRTAHADPRIAYRHRQAIDRHIDFMSAWFVTGRPFPISLDPNRIDRVLHIFAEERIRSVVNIL